MDLHERPRQVAAAANLLDERREPALERVVGALTAREVLDRVLNLLVGQTHAVHDAPRDPHFVLGDAAVDLRNVAHDLERRLEKQPADLAHGAAARSALALIPLMPDEDAEQRTDGPGDDGSDEPTDPFAEPLHPLSELSMFVLREVAETRREGSLSCL